MEIGQTFNGFLRRNLSSPLDQGRFTSDFMTQVQEILSMDAMAEE